MDNLAREILPCDPIVDWPTNAPEGTWRITEPDSNGYAHVSSSNDGFGDVCTTWDDDDKAKARMIVRARNSYNAMLSALLQAEDYFDARADVKDGSYGVPEPNAEMTILTEIRAAIAKATGGT